MKKNPKKLTILPTNQLLQQVWDYLISRPSKKGEYKKSQMECLYLLGWKVGLRISEALSFDLSLEHGENQYKNLYLLRGKGKKERWVYVSEEITKELKRRNWKANQTNRFTFSKFLEQVKKELNISNQIELSPHTLRRCFATYNAISGMPLAVLQKVLGHSKVSTTALYVKDGDLSNLVKFRPI
ncbi:tyrosine-type recombinase/integrase [endosymbiont GvMRE of Glomus versiforme]|uniref:tyrosine-type recombinase/integrase n=1 Tax=endosymbiont GvMRE of Glomus versiforme TaxID=2039283 RepID=UPI000ED639D3|nr:tyrosine-type recombinase/integrase [endosymbiont GvMRE of Glomus versiforme]RHZ35644.1 Tyrosine recombinase XerD [endosymbiont GvMRE of Glomus versiforme]